MHDDSLALPGGFRIRTVVPGDNVELASLLRVVMEEFGVSGEGSSFHDPEVRDMAAAYASQGSAYFVVESEENLVGGGGLGPLAGGAPGTSELRKMYLKPDARGHGVGRALLARCLDSARQQGYQRIYLETRKNMLDARRLYERNGFTAVTTPMGHTGHFGCDAWYVRDL
jgi:putative acetyltransferase